MIDLETLVMQSFSTINDRFNIAQKDLQDIVNEMSNVLKKVTGVSSIELGIAVQFENETGSCYRVYLDANPGDPAAYYINVASFKISLKGYPIEEGVLRQPANQFSGNRELSNPEEIRSYFAQMIQDPDSSLVQAVSFIMRKASVD